MSPPKTRNPSARNCEPLHVIRMAVESQLQVYRGTRLQQLIVLAREGSTTGLRLLHQTLERHLVGYLYWQVGSRAAAERIATDAFTHCFLNMSELPADRGFRRWLFETADELSLRCAA